MSRRTKLLITALFLVMLAIPAAYVAMSWRPLNPLRFRLISIAEEPDREPGSRQQYFAVQVSVENRTPFPMCFYGASASDPRAPVEFRDGPPGLIVTEDMRERLDSIFLAKSQILIPARSEIEVTGFLAPELRNSTREGGIVFCGDWQSHTRALAGNALSWISYKSPQWAQDFIPNLDQLDGASPLEIDEHSLAPPPAPSAQ